MTNLFSKFSLILDIAKIYFQDSVLPCGNFKRGPVPPKMSDLEIVALSLVSEAFSIDSENLLFNKLASEHGSDFPNLIDRTRYNRRRKQLLVKTMALNKSMASEMNKYTRKRIVDSIPCPIVMLAREKRCKICKERDALAPAKGYSAVSKSYFFGYKMQLVISEKGVFDDMQVTPGNVHDINFLKSWETTTSRGKLLIGDRGYLSAKVQLDLFESFKIRLEVPYRNNMNEQVEIDPKNRSQRKRIETMFSQFCDQFMLKRNYAKSYVGWLTRLWSKITSFTWLQFLNFQAERPLNNIKHTVYV